jgi:serine/threonine protein kinase
MDRTIVNFPSKLYIDNFGRIVLSGLEDDNSINIDGIDYTISFIYDDKGKQIKGGNSIILKLNSPNLEDSGDEDLPAEGVMKICKFPLSSRNDLEKQRIDRFNYEIGALLDLKDRDNNVIEIKAFGIINIGKQVINKYGKEFYKEEYLYYVIDYAEYTLPAFLKQYSEMSMFDKIDLCYGILNGIRKLRRKGYYHRDIKADNILFVKGEWKISDLGLADNQNDDVNLDLQNEKIGSYGWLSPEVMNKVLTENKAHIQPPLDCEIDFRSDIFQIGKLFWFIFQGNLPIGNIKPNDFRGNDDELFEILLWLLQYDKQRRPKTVKEINDRLIPIQKKYLNSV